MALLRGLNEPVWEADALNTMGWHAAKLGDYDTARVHCQAALDLHRHQQDRDGEADDLDSLAFIDHRTGDHHRAVDHYREALSLYRRVGNTVEAAVTLENLGHPHAALGQIEQARAIWQEALELYRQQGRDTDIARVQRLLDDLGQTGYVSQGNASGHLATRWQPAMEPTT